MVKFLAFICVCVMSYFLCFTPSALASSVINEVKVSLGNQQGELRFFPDNFEFVSGQKYKIVLDNPSVVKHYFTARSFAATSWTQKVDAGNVEIKGAIYELELKPNAKAQWVLIPMKPGVYELRCSIPGHTEAGMTGKITVKES